MLEQIKHLIEAGLPDAVAYIENPLNDGQHFQAYVISPSFAGQPLVRQHQAVMKTLKEAFETDVHALSLKTFTPEKWAAQKAQFGYED